MKKVYRTIGAITISVFALFMIYCLIIGGDALNGVRAARDYQEYQPGSYYVAEHGNYTEVSYLVWIINWILGCVVLVLFPATCIVSLIYYLVIKKIALEQCKGHDLARHFRVYRIEDHALVGECILRLGHNENTF